MTSRILGSAPVPGRMPVRDIGIILVVGFLGVMLAHQGWRTRVPGTYVIPSLDAAQELLSTGRLPDHGVATPFNAYSPPGLAWLFVPGMVLLSDPRLFDAPANAIVHFATLFGVFVLARACFGTRCALLSVLLYGVSERGLQFAATYEPRGLPFVYVWMAYWTCWWVARKDSRYLAAALVTWLLGLYMFMEVAPAVFMLPATWARYRPPVRLRDLVVAGALGLVVWAPYLRFEAGRGFADVRAQVLLQKLDGWDGAGAWCDRLLTVRQWEEAPAAAASDSQSTERASGFAVGAGRRVLGIARSLVSNFEHLVPGAQLFLTVLLLAGLLLMGVDRIRAASAESNHGLVTPPWPTVLAAALIICGALANEAVVGYALRLSVRGAFAVSTIHVLQAIAIASGGALIARHSITRVLKTLALRLDPAPCDARVLGIALVVPWLVLSAIVEWGRQGDRLVALWPLQAVIVASVAVALSAHVAGTGRWARWAIPVLIVSVVSANPLVRSRVDGWRQDGWAGVDAVEVHVADYLATRLRAQGRDRAMIGHRMFLDGPPEAPWNAVDAVWRDGEQFDVLLEYRHGIANLNQCSEDVSAQDEYRIVEVRPPAPSASRYVDVPTVARLRLSTQIGNYQIYERD